MFNKITLGLALIPALLLWMSFNDAQVGEKIAYANVTSIPK